MHRDALCSSTSVGTSREAMGQVFSLHLCTSSLQFFICCLCIASLQLRRMTATRQFFASPQSLSFLATASCFSSCDQTWSAQPQAGNKTHPAPSVDCEAQLPSEGRQAGLRAATKQQSRSCATGSGCRKGMESPALENRCCTVSI